MALFGRGRGTGTGITPAQRAAALDVLESGNRDLPMLPDVAVLSSIDMPQLVEPGQAELLRGQVLEIWQLHDPSLPFAACVYKPDLSIQMLLVCQVVPAGVYLLVFTPDGGHSAHGPMPERPDREQWTSLATGGAVSAALRAAMAARGEPAASPRVRAADYEPVQQLVRAGAKVPLVESWIVADVIGVAGIGGAIIEIWTGTIDLQTQPANPYRTPLVAAGLDPHRRIVAMAAIETMPNTHDDAYLIVFRDGARANLGARPDLLNPANFRDAAVQLLTAEIAAAIRGG